MTDLAVLASGFGVLPLAAILICILRGTFESHREQAWGLLSGIVGFLALSHAMAFVLVDKAYLSLVVGAAQAIVVPSIGLIVGAGLGWILFESDVFRTEPLRVLGAAAAFVALHSVGDGLVLGADFALGAVPSVRIDALAVGATVLHRFAEGALIVVPALAAVWKPRSTFVLLFVSLAAIPAAYVPGWVFDVYGASPERTVVDLAVPTFVAAIETMLGLILLVRGFLPLATANRGSRWLAWTAIGFIGISIVHFLVE